MSPIEHQVFSRPVFGQRQNRRQIVAVEAGSRADNSASAVGSSRKQRGPNAGDFLGEIDGSSLGKSGHAEALILRGIVQVEARSVLVHSHADNSESAVTRLEVSRVSLNRRTARMLRDNHGCPRANAIQAEIARESSQRGELHLSRLNKLLGQECRDQSRTQSVHVHRVIPSKPMEFRQVVAKKLVTFARSFRFLLQVVQQRIPEVDHAARLGSLILYHRERLEVFEESLVLQHVRQPLGNVDAGSRRGNVVELVRDPDFPLGLKRRPQALKFRVVINHVHGSDVRLRVRPRRVCWVIHRFRLVCVFLFRLGGA